MSAILSPCRKYRYKLHRKTGSPLRWVKLCLFIMLNPSTADETVDDRTIKKCIKFALREGCTDLTVVNLFAFRATEPEDMKAAEDPVGPLNDMYIMEELERHRSHLVVAAWGNHGVYRGRGTKVREMAKSVGVTPMCFKVTGQYQPIHPLYQPDNQQLIDFIGF